jgi:antitoxin component YwqK of YwqJK toxin-antitoxin module
MLKLMQVINYFLMTLIYFFIFISQVVAQDTSYNINDSLGVPQGTWIMRDKYNGRIRGIYSHKNDMRNGLCIDFYDNQNIQNVSFYINDTINGESIVYRQDGGIYQIYSFKMGKQHGLCKFFDFDGKLISSQEYWFGLKQGILQTFYKSGRISSETMYVSGYENGTRKIFSDDEKHEIIKEFDFVKGERLKSRFYKHGKVVKEENEKNDKPSNQKCEGCD